MERKNLVGTLFSVFMMIVSVVANAVFFSALFTVAAVPNVAAANGLGEIDWVNIGGFQSGVQEGVITVGAEKDIALRLTNNQPLDSGNCIDEIIVTFPPNWQGKIDTATSTVTQMGDVILTNEMNSDTVDPTGTPGTYSGVEPDDLSLRIRPDTSGNKVSHMLCAGASTVITMKGLKAPVNPEDSTVTVLTSDDFHNEASSAPVRGPISVLPLIHVTMADLIEVQYLDFTQSPGDAPLDPVTGGNYEITAQAVGGWGRLENLSLKSSVATTIDVYLDDGNGVFDGGDYKIAGSAPVGTTTTTVSMSYTNAMDVVGNVENGYVRDSAQSGSNVKYHILVVGAAATLELEGHDDIFGGQAIDPTYSGTGYTSPPKEGTVLNVEEARNRQIHVQLVRVDGSGRHLYVRDDNIPIYYTTTLSSFLNPSPRTTDVDGEVEIQLRPETTAGNALITLTFPDPYITTEDVAIAPGAPHHWEITKGKDTTVEAGDFEDIEVTIYDQYGNVISNSPVRPDVTFEILSEPDPVSDDAELDDDTLPPYDNDNFELESADFGIADTTLLTSHTIGDHLVEVCVNNPSLGCKQTTITGVLGQAQQVDCILPDLVNNEVNAEAAEFEGEDPQTNYPVFGTPCFDVQVRVKDKNGNPLEKWESLVRISLDDLDIAGNGGSFYIQSTDLREEALSQDGKSVQGKLNNNDPAYATLTICGCEGLGEFDLTCSSDTLDDDVETINVINSKPTCINLDYSRDNECADDMQLQASILDTCGNKVIDQKCSEGGNAASCVNLEASCGVFSSDSACIDLENAGYSDYVDFDTSNCGCGDITVTATDIPDCCPSVYDGTLEMCYGPLVINKQGPATGIDLEVYPYADNQDDFWVSEKTVAELTLRDDCDQEVSCEPEKVNVELSGEDCVDDTIQVDSPLETEPIPGSNERCGFDETPVHKVVIENCGSGDKFDGTKEWTDLPEKADLVVDKIAFAYTGPVTKNISACVYEETEETAGFQPGEDILWKCIDLDTVPVVPSEDADAYGNEGAADGIHFNYPAGAPVGLGGQVICHNDHGDGPYVTKDPIGFGGAETHVSKRGTRDHLGDHYGPCNGDESITYLIELDDRISKYNGLNEYDNQRLGGAIVEPGDTKDFYIVLKSKEAVPCGTYDADYLYFQDYNSPDIIGWEPYNFPGTHVRDTLEGTENYTRRNDDYETPDPYPVTSSTPSYGFGDRILHNLVVPGTARVYFRDLVSEIVNIFVDTGLPVTLVNPKGLPVVTDNQAELEFLPQPATQVVARNHGDLSAPDSEIPICDDAGYEPSYEYDRDMLKPAAYDYPYPALLDMDRNCRPAQACEGEGYDINLQVTDGFQNQVDKDGIEVQLHSCLTFPHYLYLGDSILTGAPDVTIDVWDMLDLHDQSTDPWDACFDIEKFKTMVSDVLGDYFGNNYEALAFVESQEFENFIQSIFAGKDVKFIAQPGFPLTTDAAGHTVVTTDADGKAIVRVESDDSSLFQIRSFDTSFRLFFVPHGLDADYFDVAFAPGKPFKYDLMAVPEGGVPADGEQEAKVLVRKLDRCDNPVVVTDELVTVSVDGDAVISRDFNHENNYDQDVTGYFDHCSLLWPWFEDCSLTVLDDTLETVNVDIVDASSVSTCEGFHPNQDARCSQYTDAVNCNQNDCHWVEQGDINQPDSTQIEFIGAPIKLKITEIKHSDLLPADGWRGSDVLWFDEMPQDACSIQQIRDCTLKGEPEVCFKNCVEYGNTGAWVTVEVQDKFDNHVVTYLGDGFKGDPGDKYGFPDYKFEKICVGLDDPRAFISDSTFGWIGLDSPDAIGPKGKIYCGDLAFGKGSFKVDYSMLDSNGQPLDPRETRKVIVSVFDVCDRDLFNEYVGPDSVGWKQDRWDDLCNAQEYNENNLPDSETASRLDPDAKKIIYTGLPDRWGIQADKVIVAADGEDYTELEINAENPYMDVRTRLDATVQSSLLGSKLESEAITPGCYVEGTYDPINPTSINVMTEDCSGGRAKLRLSSTEPGTARVTVTGNGFGCKEWITGKEYKKWFELVFGEGYMTESDLYAWSENCTANFNAICINFDVAFGGFGIGYSDCDGDAASTCEGLALSYHEYYYEYGELAFGGSMEANSELYTPYCKDWGVIPLTPAEVEVEFKQAFQDKIELKEGWNFFSVPEDLDPSNDNWNELGLGCDSSALWDDSTQSWVTNLGGGNPQVRPLEGYWCHKTSADTVSVIPLVKTGVYLPPSKHIYAGWNDVGLANQVEMKIEHALISIDKIYSLVLDWVEAMQKFIPVANTGELGGGDVPGTTGTNDMEAGQGYFLYTETGGDLAGQS